MELALTGSAVLCSAATSGLGLASARAFARETLRADGTGDVLAVDADITDPDHVAAFVERTAAEFGGIDHVVTSAGGPLSGPFDALADRDWYRAYDTLVMSVVWTLREAAPHLRESETGTLTAITSRTVREVRDGLLLSNAVRRAVVGLVKTVSREWAPEIRANAVLPGAHETGRIEDLIEAAVERGSVADYDAGYRDRAADVPLSRLGDPQELGDVVAFLSSPRASYVNGAALAVDGGSMRSA